MTHQITIFEHMEKFPFSAGYKEPTTSLEAAQAIEKSGRAAILRDKCLKAIHASIWGLTADETAADLGESILGVRPRISELRARGLIRKTDLRRRNASGMSASVWVVV